MDDEQRNSAALSTQLFVTSCDNKDVCGKEIKMKDPMKVSHASSKVMNEFTHLVCLRILRENVEAIATLSLQLDIKVNTSNSNVCLVLSAVPFLAQKVHATLADGH